MKTEAQMNADEIARIREGLASSNDPHLARLNREASDADLMNMKAAFARAERKMTLKELTGE